MPCARRLNLRRWPGQFAIFHLKKLIASTFCRLPLKPCARPPSNCAPFPNSCSLMAIALLRKRDCLRTSALSKETVDLPRLLQRAFWPRRTVTSECSRCMSNIHNMDGRRMQGIPRKATEQPLHSWGLQITTGNHSVNCPA